MMQRMEWCDKEESRKERKEGRNGDRKETHPTDGNEKADGYWWWVCSVGKRAVHRKNSFSAKFSLNGFSKLPPAR